MTSTTSSSEAACPGFVPTNWMSLSSSSSSIGASVLLVLSASSGVVPAAFGSGSIASVLLSSGPVSMDVAVLDPLAVATFSFSICARASAKASLVSRRASLVDPVVFPMVDIDIPSDSFSGCWSRSIIAAMASPAKRTVPPVLVVDVGSWSASTLGAPKALAKLRQSSSFVR